MEKALHSLFMRDVKAHGYHLLLSRSLIGSIAFAKILLVELEELPPVPSCAAIEITGKINSVSIALLSSHQRWSEPDFRVWATGKFHRSLRGPHRTVTSASTARNTVAPRALIISI